MLTTKQVADNLGVSDSQVRRLISAGKIKATRLGPRVWMIDEHDLATYRQRPAGRMGRPRNFTRQESKP